MDSSTQVAAWLAEVNHELSRTSQEPVTFERVAARAVSVVPGCEYASITLRRRRNRMETVAATGEIARRCDELQYELGEGPCVDAAQIQESFAAEDLILERRWPTWAARAVEAGARSLLGIRLGTDEEAIGAVNLYSTQRRAFDVDAVDLAMIFGAVASDALARAQLVEGLRAALESRHGIGVAQGILMERYDLSLSSAFEVMRRFASEHNIKVRDLVGVVIETRGLPESWPVAPASVLAEPDPV